MDSPTTRTLKFLNNVNLEKRPSMAMTMTMRTRTLMSNRLNPEKRPPMTMRTRTLMLDRLNLEKRPPMTMMMTMTMKTKILISDRLNLEKRPTRNSKPHENATVCILNLCQPLVKICYSAAASLSKIYPEHVHCDLTATYCRYSEFTFSHL